jgi:hypothetical protein
MYEIIFFILLKIYILHQHIKTIQKYKNNNLKQNYFLKKIMKHDFNRKNKQPSISILIKKKSVEFYIRFPLQFHNSHLLVYYFV